ncbi:Uncharacterised protein [Escherichia coli]|uniref:Uncharacterized protein n=1 Tax=Escherichia coli TaxID=562 RepID=A0A376VP59_ECOLX|nr:Uncharacterised protein [Escherichia coli]
MSLVTADKISYSVDDLLKNKIINLAAAILNCQYR